MKKLSLIWIFVLILLAYSVNAWTDCTPTNCTSGYTDNGIYCTGGTCYRNCTANICDSDWTQIYSTTFGFAVTDDDEELVGSSSYQPNTTAKCYNFTYKGPPASSDNIRMYNSPHPTLDCRPVMLGGFKEDTTNPWFSGMEKYLGADNSDVSYMRWVVQASMPGEQDSDQTYMNDASKTGHISCGPSTVACQIMDLALCDTDCYNRSTKGWVVQGYYEDKGTALATISNGRGCGYQYAAWNRMIPVNFTTYETDAIVSNNDKTCDRTNEAPSVTGVKVIPENPTAGNDLICNYTYYDPEDFEEKNSTYEWWKNTVNQNINNQVLGKGNLTVNDQWYCKVTPGDGLTYGTKVQSSNTVTIASTVQNLKMYVNISQAWTQSGYYADSGFIPYFEDELQNAIDNCNEDAQGYCNISVIFSSDSTGILNLSNLEVFYKEVKQPVGDTFKLKQNSEEIAIFDSAGNLFLKNTLTQSTTPIDTADDEFLLKNDSGTVVAKINSTGYMEIKGTLAQNQGNLTNPPGNDFLIKEDNGNVVARINESGYLFLKGTLYENSIS